VTRAALAAVKGGISGMTLGLVGDVVLVLLCVALLGVIAAAMDGWNPLIALALLVLAFATAAVFFL
jgi:hypothetical protein